ncbi:MULTISPECIES: SAV_2336 N-terminal domain-related protein [unclassified Streptomyces]|uniref:SAV_2336 N-terminal domain-related protein n=1 Tax=unclassified Streptomyces TaxID=2593676 RepID=UPI0029AE39BD|nr:MULTISPECIES: SAV_2336 N-terminal domain-related protein [unclassified Streptomyces]MDX3765754.1 SAV_2336 N-terminal domain-related protein [Streptomyces sp. AK08-01B]MDX3816073.1 SAV_2336 N-terminal domain-related protein [Streptomyces sp. AK08-01A]
MPDAAARHDPEGGPLPGSEPGSEPEGRAPEPYAGDLLPALVARLREAGLDPDAEQLCDALWLARWTRRPDAPEGEEESGVTGASSHGRLPGERPATPSVRPANAHGVTTDTAPVDDGAAQEDPGDTDHRISLYPVPLPNAAAQDGVRSDEEDGLRGRAGRTATTLTLGVPAAPALPAPLELQRALRPLQRYRPVSPPTRRVLDETATAELSARAGGLIIPVFRGVSRADALLQFVMDASSSMRVWDRMFGELQQVFSQLGAFRDVQVRYLHRGPDGSCAVSRSPDPAAAPLNSADRLSDPTGRRVTVLVSDCAGPLWHSGRAHRLLHQLARQAPTAVLQPLPQRMWNRTRLPVTYGALSRGEGLSGAAVLKVTEEAGGVPTTRPGALAVPVLPPVAGALAAWARLLSGTGAGRISGAVGWVRGDQPAAPAPRPGDRMSSLQLVSRFRSTASPVAGQLAVYLAAAPLYLPVMQLVQRTMLPDSGPSELAEVLLSGLLSRSRADVTGMGQWYEFAPGVQEALLGPLGRDEALLVLKHCSEYIEQRFGKGGPNFPALAYAQLGEGRGTSSYVTDIGPRTHGGGFGEHGESEEGDESGERGGSGSRVPHPFAEVAARVLERFMPLPEQFALYGDRRGHGATDRTTHTAVESARALLRHFDTDSMVQYLIDAVQLLRGATEHEERPGADPELWAEYARCVLRLWEVQGGSELLREAEHAAELAAAQPGAARERAVLAKVLHAAADDRRRRGDRRGALNLLRRADAEYTIACAAAGLDPAEALRLTLERVRAMEAQWRLSGDSSLLQGAVGMLEAFADVWPDQENRPMSLALAHGRTLLHLARATADPEQSRLYAGQGARSLRKVLSGEGGEHTMGGAQTRILLDLVDALLASGTEPDEAATLVEQALATVRDQRTRALLQLRAGRVSAARYEHTGDADELGLAAEWFGRAARGMPRDSRAHADLLAEWGEIMLRRAELPDGRPYIGTAVRILRDCRTETPSDSDSQADRLLMLGRALMLRHRATEDRVDLREAEHLFGLAAREARDPLTAARCLLELGRSHVDAYHVLRRPARLDEAAEAFRDAAESARTAAAERENPQQFLQAVELSAQANHCRGMTYEEADRPRAAREAYRAAAQEWRTMPDGGGAAGEATAARLAELER